MGLGPAPDSEIMQPPLSYRLITGALLGLFSFTWGCCTLSVEASSLHVPRPSDHTDRVPLECKFSLHNSKRHQCAGVELPLCCMGHSRREEHGERATSIPKACVCPQGIDVMYLLGSALVCFSGVLESGVSNPIKGKHVNFVLNSRPCRRVTSVSCGTCELGAWQSGRQDSRALAHGEMGYEDWLHHHSP